MQDNEPCFVFHLPASARLAQSAERKALNLVVVGSSPMVGDWNLEMILRQVYAFPVAHRNQHAFVPVSVSCVRACAHVSVRVRGLAVLLPCCLAALLSCCLAI